MEWMFDHPPPRPRQKKSYVDTLTLNEMVLGSVAFSR